MIRTSREAPDIERRFFRDELTEDHANHTIVSAEGRQRYFRAMENQNDVLIRHNVQLNRFNRLNAECTEFVPTANQYVPDTTRPFTRNDLIRDPTTVEYITALVIEQTPGSIAGTAIGAGVGVVGGAAVIALTPFGAAAASAVSSVGAKAIVGAKATGHLVAGAATLAQGAATAHPVAAAVIGVGAVEGAVALVTTEERDATN